MRESVKRPAREADCLFPSFAKVNDVGNIPLWYTAQLSFTFTVALIIVVSSGIVAQCCQGFF